jgi:predicted nuclease of predicted toxin-antitoxin system
MSKSFYKHKLLFDENMAARRLFPRLNEHFDVKHVRDDLNIGGSSDSRLYAIATEQGRVLVTKNGRDFRALVSADGPGVLDLPDGWTNRQIDSKLTALLTRHGPKYFAGHYRTIATE